MDGQTDEFMPPLDGQMNGPLDSQMKDHICQTDDELILFLDGQMINRIGQMDGIDDVFMPQRVAANRLPTHLTCFLFPQRSWFRAFRKIAGFVAACPATQRMSWQGLTLRY